MHLVLELTDAQASNLRGILDVALKATGLQVAAAAVEIDALILKADQARSEKVQGRAPPSRKRTPKT